MAAPKTASPISNAVLAERLGNVQSDVGSIKETLSTISQTIAQLTTVETRQADQSARLSDLFQIMTSQREKIGAIEVLVPGLVETRRWVVGGVVSGVAMMLIAVASLVLRPFQTPQHSTFPSVESYGVPATR